MPVMGQILLGIVAFVVAFAFDWASWRRIPGLKPVLGLAAVALFGAALWWALSTPGRFAWPKEVVAAGWALLALGTLLLVYSLFLEIPFAATYARQGVGDTLVRTGTYALVRHPGVLWFGIWMLGCILASRSRLMLAAGAIWLLCDALYAWLQEVVLFPRMFAGYRAYQDETPMFVPTACSIGRCVHTLRIRPASGSYRAGGPTGSSGRQGRPEPS